MSRTILLWGGAGLSLVAFAGMVGQRSIDRAHLEFEAARRNLDDTRKMATVVSGGRAAEGVATDVSALMKDTLTGANLPLHRLVAIENRSGRDGRPHIDVTLGPLTPAELAAWSRAWSATERSWLIDDMRISAFPSSLSSDGLQFRLSLAAVTR